MMIEIPYIGHLNTQTNDEKLSAEECTLVYNIDLFEPGNVVKRSGRAVKGFFNETLVTDLIRVKDSDPSQDRHIWIGYDQKNKRIFKITDI
jgi:hypothetical protein